MEKMKNNKIYFYIALIFLLIGFTGCGENKNNNNAGEINNNETINTVSENDEIVFSDFLVERCVRKTLNKDWDYKITKKDIENIKEFVIDNVLDPSIGENWFSGNPLMNFYSGYIDLSDLKYFTGLEELNIDNLVNFDMVVNFDAVSACKELKTLRMQYNNRDGNLYAGANYGYKYLADIFAQLPNLEYVDLGVFVTSHMKEIMLSKSSNKDVYFYNGENNEYAVPLNTNVRSYPNPLSNSRHVYGPSSVSSVTNLSPEYYYDGNATEQYDNGTSESSIPIVEVTSNTDLEKVFNYSIKADIEDLVILCAADLKELDCGLFAKFKNLCTLSLIKKGSAFGYVKEKEGRNERLKLNNTENLSNLSKLQVVNLAGCKGDFSGLGKIKELRELSMNGCVPDNMKFLSECVNLAELKLLNFDERYSEDFAYSSEKLSGLKMFQIGALSLLSDKDNITDSEITDSYIKYLYKIPSLETIYANYCSDFSLIGKCLNLKNIVINQSGNASFDKLSNLKKLESIYVRSSGVDGIDTLFTLPELTAVRILSYELSNVNSELFSDWSDKILKHEKISAFNINLDEKEDFKNKNYSAAKKMYDKGIYMSFIEARAVDYDGVLERSFDEIWNMK